MHSKNKDIAEEFLNKAIDGIDVNFTPNIVLPGKDVTTEVTKVSRTIKIGDGLKPLNGNVMIMVPGKMNYRPPTNYWIDINKTRYFPKTNDQVIGIIEDKGVDWYTVNIFCGALCLLNRLSFEGATKRNKPEMKRGDIIYARIESASVDFDTELTCLSNSFGSKKEWSTGETVYGELPEGILLKVNSVTSSNLLKQDNIVLNTLGRYLPFEVAVGMNYIVWVRASCHLHTILIRNAILNSEQIRDTSHIQFMIEQLILQAKIN